VAPLMYGGADQSAVKSISRQHASPGRFIVLSSERPLVEQTSCGGAQSLIGAAGHERHVTVRLNYDLPPILARPYCWHFVGDGRNIAASISPRNQP
jgi:hypothetical protein